MARKYLLNSTTGFGTATDWGSETNTPTIHATSVLGALSGTPQYTPTFTAPNTTNACCGMWFYISAGAGTATITLQQNLVDTAATVTVTPPTTLIGWFFAKFPTPFVFTSTTAGYYRFKMTGTGALRLSLDSGGVNTSFIAVDNRSGAPGATDDLWIGASSSAGKVTLTLTGTNGWGSNTETTNTGRSVGLATILAPWGQILEDYTTTNTTTIKGWSKAFINSEWNRGTIANPIAAGQVSTLIITMNVTAQAGIVEDVGSVISRVGQSKTYYYTLYVSGSGTTGSPLVTADTTGWAVNDELRILATSDSATNYNELESRFIKTIAGTSITLSNTAGGVEAGLTYTHTTSAYILNVTRNVITTTSSSALGASLSIPSQTSAATGTNNITKWASFLLRGNCIIGSYNTFDYNVGQNDVNVANTVFFFSSTANSTFNHNIVDKDARTGTAASGPFYMNLVKNCTFNDFWCVGQGITVSLLLNTVKCKFNRLRINALGNGSAAGHGIYLSTSNDCVWTNCEFNAIRISGTATGLITHVNSSLGNKFITCSFGNKGAVRQIVANSSSTYNTILFDNCTFGSYTNLISGQLLSIIGSKYKFTNFLGTNDNVTYSPEGVYQSTGTGLVDTTVHTAGGFALRFSPESTALDPQTWEFTVPTGNIQNREMTFIVWLYINSANYYSGTYSMPSIDINYDNGSHVYGYAGQVAGSWQRIPITFTPATTFGQIYITISAKTDQTTTNGYVYLDDFSVQYPAGYQLNLGTLDNWAEAFPVTPPISTNITEKSVADAVWDDKPSEHNVAGSFSKAIKMIKNLLMSA